MRWIALLLALAAASALAALGRSRARKARPSVRELERRLLAARPLAPAESKTHLETSRVSPDARTAPAHPLARTPAHLVPEDHGGKASDVGGGGGRLGAIARFLGRLLLLLTGAPLLMVDSSEPNPPPIAADDMPAASDLVAKVQSVCPVEAEREEEDKAAALDLDDASDSDCALEDEDESEAEQETGGRRQETTPQAVRDVFFDGLQFYKILTAVGRGAVQSAVDAATARATQSLAAKRPLPQAARPDSIAFIRERYPDFICLLRTATHPTRSSGHVHARRPHSDSFPPRLDLVSALLLSSPPSASGPAAQRRPPPKGEAGAKDVEERAAAGSEQVRRAAALASPKPTQLDGFLRVA